MFLVCANQSIFLEYIIAMIKLVCSSMPNSHIVIFVPVIYSKVNTTKLGMYFYIKTFEALNIMKKAKQKLQCN